MNSLKIVFTSILLAIVYGIIHDLITTQICIEYFTITHPKIIESEHPIILALLWGTIATWWVGLLLGVLIVFSNSFRKYPPIKIQEITKMIIRFLLFLFGIVIFIGIVGFVLAELNVFYLIEPMKSKLKGVDENRFLAVAWMHGASYIVGCIGIILLSFKIYNRRKKIED